MDDPNVLPFSAIKISRIRRVAVTDENFSAGSILGTIKFGPKVTYVPIQFARYSPPSTSHGKRPTK
jgi:hypothetical protein